jgi:hypothetical protein
MQKRQTPKKDLPLLKNDITTIGPAFGIADISAGIGNT